MKDTYTQDDIYAKPGITLLSHMLDVGVIAEQICKIGRGAGVIEKYSALTGINKNDLINTIAFLCAVHDIGKASIWQNKLADVYEPLAVRLESLNMRQETGESEIRHERYSAFLVAEYLCSVGLNQDVSSELANIIAYHHQGKPGSISDTYPPVSDTIADIQKQLLDEIYAKWPVSKEIEGITDYFCGLSNLILSIMIVSDWIASGSKWQEIKSGKNREEKAQKFFEKNLLLYHSIESRLFSNEKERNITWKTAFPEFDPNDMQKTAVNAAKDGFDVMIIEAPCGQGKTEAGLAAATIAGKKKSGIYFAMPTTATAKRIVPRVRSLAQLVGINENIPELDSSSIWSDDDSDKIDKELWSSSPRHHMLYPFSVGTVDQIIKTVTKYRYGHIGLLGLADKVIVIDEVHAYDAYMLTELQTLIRYCRFMGCPVVLLSATLNTGTKKQLLEAAGCRNPQCSLDYPLITIAKSREIREYKFSAKRQTKSYQLKRNRLPLVDEMYNIACSTRSGCTAFITDTVDNAIELYNKLKENPSLQDVEIVLYHSRDTVFHKTEVSNKLEILFGKDRLRRPKKAFLVATSIIEQSLDIDMDYLVTALAPFDLLIQRFGRQARHSDKRTIREHECIDYPITVLIPEQYGALELIYDKQVLDNTVKELTQRSSIDTIDDVRQIIDKVYDRVDFKSLSSKMFAGSRVLSNPALDTPNDVCLSDTVYRFYDSTESNTRAITYPTTQMAILDRFDEKSLTLGDIRRIQQNNVVTVSVKKIESFTRYTKSEKIEGVRIYIGEDGIIKSDNKKEIMRIDPERGLVFEQSEQVSPDTEKA